MFINLNIIFLNDIIFIIFTRFVLAEGNIEVDLKYCASQFDSNIIDVENLYNKPHYLSKAVTNKVFEYLKPFLNIENTSET